MINPVDMFYRTSNVFLQEVGINTDFSLVSSSWEHNCENLTTILYNSKKLDDFSIKTDTGTTLGEFFIRKDSWRVVYYRSSWDILTFLSYIGGMYNIFSVVALLLASYFTKRFLENEVLNYLYIKQKKKRVRHPRERAVTPEQIKPKEAEEGQAQMNPFEKILIKIKKYFNSLEKFDVRLSDYLPCGCTKRMRERRAFVGETMELVNKELDLASIIKKVKQVDKLKLMMLNPAQRKFFNFVPKQSISLKLLQRK